MRFRRRRFADLIERQLDVFERENAQLLADCDAALASYRLTTGDEAEERYAVYDDLLDDGREAIAELRDGFKRTLDDDAAEEYEAAFDRAALRRFPQVAAGIDEV